MDLKAIRAERVWSVRDFKRKTVLVAGGARWLGRVIGEAYAEARVSVALVDIDGEAVSATANALQEHSPRMGDNCPQFRASCHSH